MPLFRLLVVLLIALVASQAVAQDKGKKNKGNKANNANKDGVDDVVGAIWHYKVTHDGMTEAGNFRVYKLEMFKGKEKIGVVKPKDEDESTFEVRGYPELNGKATIRKVKQKSAVAKGVLVRPNGEKWDIEVEIKDR